MSNILSIIAGPSGSGKSSSMRNLGPETVVLNTERKVLPFSERGIVNIPVETTAKMDSALERLHANGTFSVVVIDSFSEYVDILMHECKQKAKGYDVYSMFNSELFMFFQRLKSLKGKDVFVIGHPEILTDADGNRIQRLRVPGKINEGMIEKNSLCTFFCKTVRKADGKGVEYHFMTNTDGELPGKSPMDMYNADTEFLIDNDIKKIIQRFNVFYGRTDAAFCTPALPAPETELPAAKKQLPQKGA